MPPECVPSDTYGEEIKVGFVLFYLLALLFLLNVIH